MTTIVYGLLIFAAIFGTGVVCLTIGRLANLPELREFGKEALGMAALIVIATVTLVAAGMAS